MGFKDRIENVLSALELATYTGSVQTADGHIGSVVSVDILDGTVTVDTGPDGQHTFPGAEVSDLESPPRHRRVE